MTILAILFGTIGVADLFRSKTRMVDFASFMRAFIAGGVVIALLIWGTQIDVWWAVPLGVALIGWLLSTPQLLKPFPWAIAGLGLAITAALALPAAMPKPIGWLVDWHAALPYPALNSGSFEHFALVVGVGIFLIDSANLVVRMAIGSADEGALEGESTVRGGRIVGPIERLLILILAAAGEYGAIGGVFAAKSIVRLPEIAGPQRSWRRLAGQSAAPTRGSKNASEYILIGSLVSWALALAAIPLLQMTA